MLAATALVGAAAIAQEQDEEPVLTIEERIERLQEQIDVLKDSITEPEGSIQATVSDVKSLKKLKVSGYVQARFDSTQGKKDSFLIRRGRVKVAGKPSPNAEAVVQIDFSTDAKTPETKDLYIAYTAGNGNTERYPTFFFGKHKVPFGYQSVQSSSERETPERARVIGMIPHDRDLGFKVSSPVGQQLSWDIGIFNGNGKNTDDNGDKDIVGRARFAATDSLDFGASFYTGKNTVSGKHYNFDRFGLDAQLYMQDMAIKGEYITGKTQEKTQWGYYGQVARNLSAKDTLVLMYDLFHNPLDSKEEYKTTTLGWVRSLDNSTRLKVFYQWVSEKKAPVKNNVFTIECITLY